MLTQSSRKLIKHGGNMHNPFQRQITAFVSTIEYAKILDIFPVLSLGMIHRDDGPQCMGKIQHQDLKLTNWKYRGMYLKRTVRVYLR